MNKRKTATKHRKQIDSFVLSERIKYFRQRRKLTQSALAKKSGIGQSTIAQIESGQKDPSISTLKEIAAALDTHIAVLFAGDEVYVFDMNRLKRRYRTVDDLNPTLYYSVGRVLQYAKSIGFV